MLVQIWQPECQFTKVRLIQLFCILDKLCIFLIWYKKEEDNFDHGKWLGFSMSQINAKDAINSRLLWDRVSWLMKRIRNHPMPPYFHWIIDCMISIFFYEYWTLGLLHLKTNNNIENLKLVVVKRRGRALVRYQLPSTKRNMLWVWVQESSSPKIGYKAVFHNDLQIS